MSNWLIAGLAIVGFSTMFACIVWITRHPIRVIHTVSVTLPPLAVSLVASGKLGVNHGGGASLALRHDGGVTVGGLSGLGVAAMAAYWEGARAVPEGFQPDTRVPVHEDVVTDRAITDAIEEGVVALRAMYEANGDTTMTDEELRREATQMVRQSFGTHIEA